MSIRPPETKRVELENGLEIAYWHEGVGGQPLLLAHGWPETKLIWEKNIWPLVEAGFEVIAPDLRGFGQSNIPADGFHDPAAHASDLKLLVSDALGHDSVATAGGDLGGVVLIDLGLRFSGLVKKQVIFNCPLPLLNPDYVAAGLPEQPTEAVRRNMDYFIRQGTDADALCDELSTAAQRSDYVESFYLERGWAADGSFTPDDAKRMAAGFADESHFRASLGNYESALGAIPYSTKPRFFETSPVETLAMYGPSDHVVPAEFPQMCKVAFENLAALQLIEGAGHFLQWEAAERFNAIVGRWLCEGPKEG